VNPTEARSFGILGIEIGVGITVMAAMISIFLDLVSRGKHEEDLE
jgi:multicomponent Na+:H+ antiporter subunit B